MQSDDDKTIWHVSLYRKDGTGDTEMLEETCATRDEALAIGAILSRQRGDDYVFDIHPEEGEPRGGI